MTNDTAMTKQESEVMIEQLKKVFEVVRLLDVDTPVSYTHLTLPTT